MSEVVVEDEQHQPMHEVKTRACLVCSAEFESGWSGERVCKRCKTTSAWRQG